ncbi:MAG: response regulator [Sphingobacteriia bacterium]|nr:MAG: response regulator [Sphingobacteriia bacterium]TAG30939.1 MAG: response regulator [Sphingobacteriia bacterium]TAH08799.1 MAG: response regulator [Sphingobacteriia bacterium]
MILRTLNILIVDGASLIMQQLSEILYNKASVNIIRFAINAEDGLKALAQDQTDMLILDINLSGMSGLEMLRKVKALYEYTLVVIILTNTPYTIYRDECLRIGADFFLDKSRDFALLPDLVDRYSHKKMLVKSG